MAATVSTPSIGIFSPDNEQNLVKVAVGVRPNGLSFDSRRGYLLAANVGSPENPGSFTLSIIDVQRKEMIHSIPAPGRTRWTVFDSQADVFYVNIADPALIVTVKASEPYRVTQTLAIPAIGPHGLDLDTVNRRLFCACDAGKLFVIDLATGLIDHGTPLSGVPDVIYYNAELNHLYVAVGDPGVIDVFDTATMNRLETIYTEKGAHTIAFDAQHNKVYAFLPQTHQTEVFADV